MNAAAPSGLVELLQALRRSEKEQALLYRGIAARAELEGLSELAQRFHDLHADEQHHLSRLTARVLELGGRPTDLSGVRPTPPSLQEWESTLRQKEAAEIERYESALSAPLDTETLSLIQEILDVERHHAHDLGGKWTMA